MRFEQIIRFRWWIRFGLIGYLVGLVLTADYYWFFLLNLPLAYIPFEMAILLYRHSFFQKYGFLYVPLSFLWLLFYPNAPYMVTDFFHLRVLPIGTSMESSMYGESYSLLPADFTVWYHFGIMIFSVMAGLTFGFISLGMMLTFWREKIRAVPLWVWVSIVTFLSSFAIYIGRFSRIHSIELILKPIDTMIMMIGVFDEPHFWSFLIVMTAVQLVLMIVWRPWIFVKSL